MSYQFRVFVDLAAQALAVGGDETAEPPLKPCNATPDKGKAARVKARPSSMARVMVLVVYQPNCLRLGLCHARPRTIACYNLQPQEVHLACQSHEGLASVDVIRPM